MKYCCEEFAKQATQIQAAVGAGLLYPPAMQPDAQFEQGEDGTWSIYGCCGGGCYVVTGMKYCPYCGHGLE